MTPLEFANFEGIGAMVLGAELRARSRRGRYESRNANVWDNITACLNFDGKTFKFLWHSRG